jgi:hypothetical protein
VDSAPHLDPTPGPPKIKSARRVCRLRARGPCRREGEWQFEGGGFPTDA